METVRNIATSVSLSAVIIGAVYILCPDGRQGKQIRFVAGLLMILAVMTPFLGASFELPKTGDNIDFSVNAEEMLAGQAKYLVSAVLSSEGIEFTKIEPFMDISQSGDISIYRLCVYGVGDKERARELLGENFPECEVIVE